MKKELILKKRFKESKGVLTIQELQSFGLTRYSINQLIGDGILERIKRGKYIHAESEEDEYYLVQQMIPTGIICLLSAAAIYNFTTHIPNTYHLAIKVIIIQTYRNTHP